MPIQLVYNASVEERSVNLMNRCPKALAEFPNVHVLDKESQILPNVSHWLLDSRFPFVSL